MAARESAMQENAREKSACAACVLSGACQDVTNLQDWREPIHLQRHCVSHHWHAVRGCGRCVKHVVDILAKAEPTL